MAPTEALTIVLPSELAKLVENELSSGRYVSMVDVLRDALQSLADRDAALETWLRDEVTAGHAEYLADSSKGVAASEVLDRIRSRKIA